MSAPADFDSIALAVRTTIAEQIRRPVGDVPLEARIEGQLDIDSMAMIEINVSLEERFGIAMPDLALDEQVETVRDLVSFIAARAAERR